MKPTIVRRIQRADEAVVRRLGELGVATVHARLGVERVAREQKTRERLRNGELGLDFYGLRAKLAELGVQYVEEE